MRISYEVLHLTRFGAWERASLLIDGDTLRVRDPVVGDEEVVVLEEVRDVRLIDLDESTSALVIEYGVDPELTAVIRADPRVCTAVIGFLRERGVASR